MNLNFTRTRLLMMVGIEIMPRFGGRYLVEKMSYMVSLPMMRAGTLQIISAHQIREQVANFQV